MVNQMGSNFLQERMRKFRILCALLGMGKGWRAGSLDTDSNQAPYSEKNTSYI